MKNSTRLIKLLLSSFFCIHVSDSFSQSTSNWMMNPYDEKVFVENKGQFASIESELGCKILYSFEQGNTTFFLCKDQFIVRDAKDEPFASEQEDEQDPATSHYPATSFTWFKFSLGDVNSSCAITGEKKSKAHQKYYLPDTSGKDRMITASAFSQVDYSNLYNGIDLIFSTHEKNGIKYQYVVHPFADASLIRLGYSGVGNMELDEEGNIHAGIRGTEIIDYAPKTFYADDSVIIPSSYSVEKNSSSILTGYYDHSQTIVIDPWVTNPNFVNQNKAFDIAGDAAGCAYVFGGHSPWQLKKFDPNGNPLWTFNTTFFDWYGALAVDPSGNSIITEGCCGGHITRIDSSGNISWQLINTVDEYWRLAYNCDFSRLYLATGYASSAGLLFESISLLDTATGAFSNSTAVFPQGPAEPRSLACGLNGNIYTLACAGTSEVLAMTPSFNVLFSVPSAYNLLYNGPLYANGSNTTSGQNGVSGGNNFFCTTDGATLYKRNINNGALISFITIPGGSVENNSGILVDSCDNIYVGSSNGVIKYDSSLNVISSTATTGAVYCLAPGINGELLVSGNGFIASMDLAVCRDIFCSGTINTQGGNMFSASDTQLCEKFCIDFFDSSSNNPTSWQWSFPGGAPGSSTDQNPTDICYTIPGVYDVMLITTSANGTDTLTLDNFITVYPTPPFPTITQIGYTLTSSPANLYQWQLNTVDIPGATNQSYTISQSGLYTVIVGDSNGCKNSASKDVLISGMDELTNGANMSIFPNPAGDEVTIQSSIIRTNEVTTITIINILGKIVEEEKVKWKGQATLDVSNLPSGIYLVKVESEKEKLEVRFVKE